MDRVVRGGVGHLAACTVLAVALAHAATSRPPAEPQESSVAHFEAAPAGRLSPVDGPRQITAGTQYRGSLGQTLRGDVFFGCGAPPYGGGDLWHLSRGGDAPHRISVAGGGLTALSRGGEALWVACAQALLQVDGAAAAPLERLQCLHDRPGGYMADAASRSSRHSAPRTVAVDRDGAVWITDAFGASVEAFWRPQRADGGNASGWFHGRFRDSGACGRTAIAAHPDGGVWAYWVCSTGAVPVLHRLVIDAGGPQPRIAERPSRQQPLALPAVANPCLASDARGGVFLAGETAEGDILAEMRDGKGAVVSVVPFEVGHGRRPTAVVAGPATSAYVATDGAGILVYEAGRWRPHPINQQLPVVAGTGLRPVDDLLLGVDGTLYAASGRTLTTWHPGG